MKTTFFLCLWLGLTWFASAGKRNVNKPNVPVGAYSLVQLVDSTGTLQASAVYGEIVFDKQGSQVQIYLGCNRITARFGMLPNTRCKPEITMSTRMACSNPVEDRFKNAFHASDRYKMQHDSLLLFSGNSTTMIMVKKSRSIKKATKDDPQGSYRLYRILDGKKQVQGTFNKTRMSIDGKQFRANVGCNSMFGEWLAEGQIIKPLRLGMTDMFCEEVDHLERLFTGNLEKSNRWRWNHGRLEFLKDQQVLLVFVVSND